MFTAPLKALLLCAVFVSSVALFGREASSASAHPAAEVYAAKRVLVLGNSITYAGTYVDLVEVVLRRENPAWRGEILDLGLPSETVSGLSEPHHAGGKFPRPDLHERLARVLAQVKPDLVMACYGMNDGIYLPFSEDRFEKFRAGILWLRQQVEAAHAKLIYLTPPIFDPLPIKGKVTHSEADTLATANPFVDYDDVLGRYSAWLLEQRAQGWNVIDIHGPMLAELMARRRAAPEFSFSKDGIHPNGLGHAIIARAILLAWGFPAERAEDPLRWEADGTEPLVSSVTTRRKLLSDAWLTTTGHRRPGMKTGLPLPEALAQAGKLEENIRAQLAKP